MAASTPQLLHDDAMRALGEVSPHAELLYILLYECSSSRSSASEGHTENRIRAIYSAFEEGECGCLVEYDWTRVLEGKLDDVEYASPMQVTIRASFEARYRIDAPGIDSSHVEAFVRTSSVFQTWPYWREYLGSMSARLNCPKAPVLPPLPIPLAAHLAGFRNPAFDAVSPSADPADPIQGDGE